MVLLNVPFAAAGNYCFVDYPFQLFDFCGDRFHCPVRYLHSEWSDYDLGIKSNVRSHIPLSEAVKNTVRSRVRPVVMTAAMAAIGLMPAALSHGIGSESQRPLAIVIIGAYCAILSLLYSFFR